MNLSVLRVLGLGLVLAACGNVTNHHVVTGQPVAPNHGTVQIFMENTPVPDDFYEIAIVQSVGSGSKADLEHVIAGLKTEAQKLGANAVVRVRVDQGAGQATAVGTAGTLP